MEIKWIRSPNFSVGRGGLKPEAIVIHIMEGTLAGTDAWFQNIPRASNVSAHYGIGKDGEIHQYVKDSDETAARTTLRIRESVPTTASKIAGKAKTGNKLKYVGWTSNGQTIDGNSHWYRIKKGITFGQAGRQDLCPGFREVFR